MPVRPNRSPGASYRGRRGRGKKFRPETLEPRMLLAAAPIITEFVADNDNSLLDGDGNSPDWIEIQNTGDEAADLNGWYLTDDPADLTQWPLPAETLDVGEFLVVFASAPEDAAGNVLDNYVDAGGNYHANFRLDANGEYLALVYDDGASPPTIASQFGSATADFPRQREDISYGLSEAVDTTTLAGAGDTANVLIPNATADAAYGNAWTGGDEAAFDAAGGLAGWTSGTGTGVGYDTAGFQSGGGETGGNVALGKPVTVSETLAADRAVKDAQINPASGAAGLGAASFTFYATPDDTSLTLLARDVPGRDGAGTSPDDPDDLLFFNGLIVRQVDGTPGLTRLAAFDVNDSGNAAATQVGLASLDDGAGAGRMTFSAVDAGVTLQVTNEAANDRDRGAGGVLAGHEQAELLRDFIFDPAADGGTSPADAMNLDISGLAANTEYVLRAYSFDRSSNDRAVSLWYDGPDSLAFGGNAALLSAHQNLSASPNSGFVDLRVMSRADGTVKIVARGAGAVPDTQNITILNGIEIFEPAAATTNVILVDVNNNNPAGGPMDATEPGFLPLSLNDPGGQSGSATNGQVTVLVRTDRDDGSTRHRNNTGEDLVADFVFADDELDVQIDGLTPGVEYEITVFSQDPGANSGQISRWLLAGDDRPAAMYDGRFPPAAVTDGLVVDQHVFTTATKHTDSYWMPPNGEVNAFVTVDLLGMYDISEIVLFNTRGAAHGTDSGTKDFELYVSIDGEDFGAPIVSGTLPMDQTGQTFGELGVQGRYVRFKANDYYQKRAGLAEIEVYGTLVESAPFNVAVGRPVSGPSLDGRFPPTAIVDGIIRDEIHNSNAPEVDSYWILADGTAGAIDVDLGGLHEISEFVLVNTINFRHSGSANGDRGTEEFQILTSPDGVNFTPVVAGILPDLRGSLPTNAMPVSYSIVPVQATYVRFQADGYYGSSPGLSELAILGTLVAAAPPAAAPEPDGETVSALRLDFNARTSGDSVAIDTLYGFTPFTLDDSGSTVDGVTVTLAPLGGSGLDDRDRTVPVETPSLSQAQLYDDFIFATSAADGAGIEILMEGLEPNHEYRLTVWSFDQSNPQNRISDWTETASGTPVPITTYTFDGDVGPVNDYDNTFTELVTSSVDGRLQIQATRNGGYSIGVFLNAMQLDSLSYDALIETDVEDLMFADADTPGNTSAWIRVPFEAAGPFDFDRLMLQMKYDDGFVAYLNGNEIARDNALGSAGTPPAFNAAASAQRDDVDAQQWRQFDVTAAMEYLVAGTNILAVYGLNVDAADDDFLILPELLGTKSLGITERYFEPPTPGTANMQGYVDFVADTRFSFDRGYYDVPIAVEITTATLGAEIYYTTDGSWPEPERGTLYTGPVTVAETTTLRAAAFLAGYRPTNVDTQTYIFLDDVLTQNGDGLPAVWGPKEADYEMDQDLIGPGGAYADSIKADLAAVPVLSIVMDVEDLWGTSGIYSQTTVHGRNTERAVSVEYFGAEDGKEFQVNAGIRIHGGNGRNANMPKHNLRLFFRDEYGPGKLQFDMFDDSNVDEFNTLILRARYGNSWLNHTESRRLYAQYIREQWTRDTMLDMGYVAPHMTPVQVYLNGMYWGLFHVMERPDEEFAASYFGGSPDDYDVMHDGAAENGDTTAYNAMLGIVNDGSRTPDEKFVDVQEYLDMDHFVDFTVMQIYGGNWDLNTHNWWATRKREPGGQFHFYPWDTEHIFQEINRDVSDFDYSSSPWRMHQALRNSPMYRMKFADRVQQRFFNGGLLTEEKVAERWMQRADEIDRAIVGESVRWGDHRLDAAPDGWATGPYQVYTRDEHWIAEQNRLLNEYFPQRQDVVLAQFAADGLWPDVQAPQLSIDGLPQHGGATEPGSALSMASAGGVITADTSLLAAGDAADYVVPLGPELDPAAPGEVPPWALPGFNPAAGTPWTWQNGATGIGYEAGTGYDGLFGIDPAAAETIRRQMRDDGDGDTEMNGSIFLRVPFTVDAAELATFTQLTLGMKYDDGFVAYLNGVPVAEANAPTATGLAWDSQATASHDASLTVFDEFDVTDYLDLLVAGTNVLAIHGLNMPLYSSDLVFVPELIGSAELTEPGGAPIYFTLDGTDPRLPDGSTHPGATQFNQAVTLDESAKVMARTLQNGQWSPLTEATFTVGTASLAISEINYHPHDPTERELEEIATLQDDSFEFLEIENTGSLAVGLVGVRFADGIEFEFTPATPITSLEAGGRVLVVRDVDAMVLRYGEGVRPLIAGEYSGGLKNGGETIRIADGTGATVTEVAYKDSPKWPQSADGRGSTLEAITTASGLSDPMRWHDSVQVGGSPGVAATAAVVGRYVFYGGSAMNGPAAGGDDAVIATDKTALLPGQKATSANYTSFGAGLTGVMVDVAHAPDAETFDAGDLVLKMGNDGAPAGWADAPDAAITIRPDEGRGGSDRIVLTWPENAIKNAWLRIDVLATPQRTGLVANDVFYFGNAPGEVTAALAFGTDLPTPPLVNAADVIAIRDNPRGPSGPAAIDNPRDVNRDGYIDALDLILARDHATGPLSALRLIEV